MKRPTDMILYITDIMNIMKINDHIEDANPKMSIPSSSLKYTTTRLKVNTILSIANAIPNCVSVNPIPGINVISQYIPNIPCNTSTFSNLILITYIFPNAEAINNPKPLINDKAPKKVMVMLPVGVPISIVSVALANS